MSLLKEVQRSQISVQRDDWLDISLPSLGTILQQIPGYDMLTVIIGFDVATGRAVQPTPSSLVRAVMGLAPGGRYVHDRLVELHVLQDVYEIINEQLTAHDLTADRLSRAADQAWDEVDLTPRLSVVSDAIDVVGRHLNAIVRDVRALASSLVDQVIRIVREAAIAQAETLLAQSEEARKIWDLAKAVLKYDPLRGETVQSTTEDIIAKFLILIGRETELEQMRARGTLTQTAAWVDEQLAQFMGIVGEFRSLVSDVLDALSFEQLPNLPSNLRNLAQRGLALIRRIASFAGTVAAKVLELIKDSLLGMLDERAQRVPGFHLLTVLIGRNPLTSQVVPRTATNIIKGFITLMPDGEAQFEQLQQTGVIPQAAARIEAAIERLGISWEFIVGLFRDIWNSFTIDDLLDPIGAFMRVVERFAEPISRLFSFVSTVVQEVFKLVLRLMGFPSDLLERIINNAIAAFDRIAADPVGFFNNLLGALKLGFTKFFDNIATHLINGLTGWLLRGLEEAGITMPAELTLQSILDVVLQVLGVTVEKVWQKLAEKIGPERVAMIRRNIERLSGVWTFIKDVQERGIVAIWEYISGKVGELWNMILDKAKNWILTELVEAAMQKLLSMLDPTGIMAVVNSFLAFFRAVQSVMRYMTDILRIVDRYVSTLASIAAGQIQQGAAQLETGLARSIPVAIGFLANQVGLGNIGDKIREFIQAGAEMVDRAIEWLIDKALQLGQAVLRSLGMGGHQGEEDSQQPPPAPVTTRPGEPSSPEEVAEHERLAKAAAQALKQPTRSTVITEIRAEKEAQARQLERDTKPHLRSDINMTITFEQRAEATADNDLDFDIAIAPNDYRLSDALRTGNGYNPAGLGPAALWRDMNTELRPGEDPAAAQNRFNLAREALKTLIVAGGFGGGDPVIFGRIDAIRSYEGGARARGFSSAVDEEDINANSHIAQRHVLGEGWMQRTELVALRALRNQIFNPGTNSWVGAFCAGTSSAYLSMSAANRTIGTFHNGEMTQDWERIRHELLSVPGNLSVERRTSLAGGITYRSAGAVGVADYPAYLNGRYGLAGCAGTRPLYPGDPNPGLAGAPLVSELNPVAALIRIRPYAGARAGGWSYLTSYPVL